MWADLNWLIVKTCDMTLRTRRKIQVPPKGTNTFTNYYNQ